MVFFKRLSRGSRSNSYVDDYPDSPRDREKHTFHDSPRQSQSQHNIIGGQPTSPVTAYDDKETGMYRNSGPIDTYVPQQQYQQQPRALNNGVATHNRTSSMAMDSAPVSAKSEAAPDLLMRAFNEALRPHQEKVEQLEAQLADLQAYVDSLEQQRSEMYSWIDNRGLRPDVPPTIAKYMDAQPDAAATLNAQLDRKITIVNFDLHRLQDDLNDSISSSHFASAMSKFLPDISRLASLPTGPRFAFDLVLKLGGNLNSHGGLDTSDPGDLAARRDFYGKLDNAMVDVVRRRFAENEDWPVQREIKRIEKTAAYLKNFGVEPYFPATLEAMRREVDFRGAAPPAQAQQGMGGSPPRYQ